MNDRQDEQTPIKPLVNRLQPGSGQKPVAPTAPSSRFNKSTNLRSRFGATPIAWDVLPLGDRLACFSLDGLGGSLKYMMENDLAESGGTYEAVLQSMEHDAKAQTRLTTVLDEVWNGYDLKPVPCWSIPGKTPFAILFSPMRGYRIISRFIYGLSIRCWFECPGSLPRNLLQPNAPVSLMPAILIAP